jgi:hypothetical protein
MFHHALRGPQVWLDIIVDFATGPQSPLGEPLHLPLQLVARVAS